MYKATIVAALAAIAFTTSFAQQSESTTPGASKQDTDKRWREMQEHMNQMHTQMEQIQKTKDPKQREKLMQEHMQSMREHMSMMHDTGGCMMMGPKGARRPGCLRQIGARDGLRHNDGTGCKAPRAAAGRSHGHDANDDGAGDAASGRYAAETEVARKC